MKTIRVEWNALLLASALLTSVAVQAQTETPASTPTVPRVIGTINDTPATTVGSQTGATASADSLPDAQLDRAVAALEKGDKAASAQALQSGIAAVEAEAKAKPSSFKDKILGQVGKLKTLLPLITGGGLGSGVLGNAVGLTKLASGAGRLENLMSAGSLIGKASQLTSGLNGLSSAMSVLGGGASAGQSLVSTALAGVGKLNQGGMVAKAAEPAVKNQIGSVLNFVKGAL
ncbi:hypothetical protein [Spirosoma montaniterrae]|uniref:Uncharacterized protein n=1 Tax=Spirosoma montaniterrae TaxID=1178516 RepID=A0A1P9X0S6_9BACT|nr:hypothetical protein [Spirosoma montaniterrae]AQG81222.1 hypothetical protein AWR27_18995 [Spirosoma montaniterrae]